MRPQNTNLDLSRIQGRIINDIPVTIAHYLLTLHRNGLDRLLVFCWFKKNNLPAKMSPHRPKSLVAATNPGSERYSAFLNRGCSMTPLSLIFWFFGTHPIPTPKICTGDSQSDRGEYFRRVTCSDGFMSPISNQLSSQNFMSLSCHCYKKHTLNWKSIKKVTLYLQQSTLLLTNIQTALLINF